MIPVYQDKFLSLDEEGNPQERGNCLQACVASVFELPLEKVPHFVSYDNWWGMFTQWLEQYNITLVRSDVRAWDTYYIRTGKSPRGDFYHAVVYHGMDMVHDPHPDGTGLDGDDDQSSYLFVVKDPASQ